MGINVLSLFDGMSCGQIALERVGIEVENYFASEVDKYAMQVTKDNYPNTKFIGDVAKVKGSDLPNIDLVIGGSPCQGFSFAGSQLNFNDTRSKLFFEFVRLLKETKPKYFLLENVVMKKEYEQVITDHLGVNPIIINSALVSAQNRKRLYWANIPNVNEPVDKKVTWGVVRERGVQNYYYTEKAMQWLGKVSQKKNKTLTVHSDSDKMQMIEASHYKKYSNQRFFGIVDLPENEQGIAVSCARKIFNGKRQQGKRITKKLTKQYIEFRYDEKTNALTTVTEDKVVIPFTLPNKISADEFSFRYITPLECERLQTVPDNYTACVSDTQRYRMLGNGWTIDVIAHIFRGLPNKNT